MAAGNGRKVPPEKVMIATLEVILMSPEAASIVPSKPPKVRPLWPAVSLNAIVCGFVELFVIAFAASLKKPTNCRPK